LGGGGGGRGQRKGRLLAKTARRQRLSAVAPGVWVRRRPREPRRRRQPPGAPTAPQTPLRAPQAARRWPTPRHRTRAAAWRRQRWRDERRWPRRDGWAGLGRRLCCRRSVTATRRRQRPRRLAEEQHPAVDALGRGGGGWGTSATAAPVAQGRVASAAAGGATPGDFRRALREWGACGGGSVANEGERNSRPMPAACDLTTAGGPTITSHRPRPPPSGMPQRRGAWRRRREAPRFREPTPMTPPAPAHRQPPRPDIEVVRRRGVGGLRPPAGRCRSKDGAAGAPPARAAPASAARESPTAASTGEYCSLARSASMRDANAATGTIAVRHSMPRPPCDSGSAARSRRASTAAGALRASGRIRRRAPWAARSTDAGSRAPQKSGRARRQQFGRGPAHWRRSKSWD